MLQLQKVRLVPKIFLEYCPINIAWSFTFTFTIGLPSVPIVTSVKAKGIIFLEIIHYGVDSTDDFCLVMLFYDFMNILIGMHKSYQAAIFRAKSFYCSRSP